MDVPNEIFTEDLTEYVNELLETPGYNPTIKGNIKQIRKAVKMIQKAERPMILAGGGVISANASEELQEFAKLINAPVATSLMGKGSIPEDDESAIGMLGMHGREVANQSVNKSDVLIAIGCRFSDRTTGQMESFVPDAKVIHIDIDPAEIGKNIEVDLPIVGDAKIILSSLIEEIKSSNYKSNSLEWLEGIKAYKKSAVPRVSLFH